MGRKKKAIGVDTSSFFEEDATASDAKKRRLERLASKVVEPAPEVIKAVKETKPEKPAKLKKQGKSWQGESVSKQKETNVSPTREPTEDDKKALAYWEKTYCVCLEDDKYVHYCDGRKAFESPIKKSGKI
jgi:hypothetical protein